MCVIPFQLFTSRGTFVMLIVSSTRPQIHCPIRRSMSVIRMVFQHIGSVPSVLHVHLLLSSCCISASYSRLLNVRSCAHPCFLRTSHSACQFFFLPFFLFFPFFLFDEIPPLFCVFQQILPFLCFSCRHVVLLERRFSLDTFPFAHPPCGNVHQDRLLVSLLLRSAFHLSHPELLSVDETVHTCCMAQAVAPKSFGSVVLSALSLHAHLIAGRTPRYARSRLRSRPKARALRVTNTLSFFFFGFFRVLKI